MNLALIGKNIQHSKSPEIYKKLLGNELHIFDLLDFADETLIPKALELFQKYQGISITSPYKKYFLNEIRLLGCPKGIAGINCMRLNNGVVEATNTDFLAIKEILSGMQGALVNRKINILGDGVMSKVTELALIDLNLSYEIFSRKKTEKFDQLTFANVLLINSCSRDYVFKGNIKKNVIFWDYNYNFLPHQNTLPNICDQYIDGYSLLTTQAKFALDFVKNVTV
jgi:shikimate dehydrogenase